MDEQERLTNQILKISGCKSEKLKNTRNITLERRMAMLSKGRIDLITWVNRRAERELYAHFSIPILEERVRLWARNKEDAAKYKSIDLLTLVKSGVKIVAPNDGWYGPDYKYLQETAEKQLVYYKDSRQGLELLYKNRGELMLGSEHFHQNFQPEYRDKTVMPPQIVHRDTLHLMYSKKTISLKTVALIDKAIEKQLALEKLASSSSPKSSNDKN